MSTDEAASGSPAWFQRALDVPREDLEVQVNGVPIRYFRWGDKSKPTVILAHGFLSHRRCWAFVAPLLAEKYNLCAFDFAGMGDSGQAASYAMADRMKEIAGFINALNLNEKPILVAHSFGGGLFMRFAYEQPDMVAASLACDTFMLHPKEVKAWLALERNNRANPLGKQKIYPTLEAILGRYVLSPPQSVEHPFLLDYMARHSVKKIAEGWTWKFDPNIMIRDESERNWWIENLDVFTGIDIPKALIFGSRSQLVQSGIVEYAAEICAKEKNETFASHIIEGAGHHIMLDKPLEFAAAIDDVLSQWV